MKIRMLVSTTYRGKFLKDGNVQEVDNETGNRFVKNRIAIEVVEETESNETIKEQESEQVVEEVDISSLTNKELFAICKEKEIELDKAKINGKTAKEKKDYLLSMLSGE
jgi:hypothetical protein